MSLETEDDKPAPRIVNLFHARSDKDSHQSAQHHTLGLDHNQSSPGDHNHDGRNSKLPLANGRATPFPPQNGANASYSQTQMNQVINALRELGAGQS